MRHHNDQKTVKPFKNRIVNAARFLKQVMIYNVKIIFANKFIYFLLAAFLLFIAVITTNLFDENWYPDAAEAYSYLLFSGLLLIFYPAAFGIQNDLDTRMIETLFGIPDYRFKVWFMRLIVVYFIVWVMLVIFAALSYWLLAPVPIMELTLQLMFPIAFIGALAFMLSTIIRNGNGAAAIVIIFGITTWFSLGFFDTNPWNLFLNPFKTPDNLSYAIWIDIMFYNRLYLSIGTVLCILTGLYKLQNREQFI